MTRPAGLAPTSLALTALAVLAVADLALLLAMTRAGLPGTRAGGALHLGLALAALGSARGLDERLAGWDGLALPLGIVAGPVGVLLLALLRPWPILPARAAEPDEEPLNRPAADDKVATTIARITDQRLRFPAANRLHSLATVLRHGDLASRCMALQTVVRSFEPKLSPLVAIALCDPDQTVRALAAATSAQVNANLAARVARIEAPGDDDQALSCEARFEAAMVLFDHGLNNVLLSQAQRLVLRCKAATMLQGLAREGDGLGRLRAPVTAALVRLGADAGGTSPARGKRGTVRGRAPGGKRADRLREAPA
ncbi:hypothetical protein ACFOD9_10215 [Novosphingobium bradum]|uniref:HEAT repeat domain-containing protein n=1 Tax=Novosphingobium bradum TaxID=1737444 RepID=A0ABV7ITT2_9SPHN